jgi:hypothetical protein
VQAVVRMVKAFSPVYARKELTLRVGGEVGLG